jgi:YihY family inner membrane protein
VTERAEAWYQDYVLRQSTPPFVRKTLKFCALLWRELERDQVLARAATLSYWSLVAIVPVLVLAAVIIAPMGSDNAGPIRAFLYRALLAGAVEKVGATLDTWLAGVDFARLGLVGVAVVMFTASRIYFNVEEAYNRLWNVRLRRGFVTRMMIFYATITFFPILVAGGFSLTSHLRGMVDVSWFVHLGPTLLTTIAFVGAIKALPDTDVHWRPALIGGLGSAILFEGAKLAFNAYTTLLGGNSATAVIYGSLALFPIFLVWLNLLWLIVLFGVKLAYVVQRLDDLMQAEERRILGHQQGRHHADALFALQCLMVIVRNYVAGRGPTDEPGVTQALGSEPIHIINALETLEAANILAASPRGWLPAVPPDRITVRDVIQRYRGLTRPTIAEGALGTPLVDRIVGAPGGPLDVTLASLVTPE